MRVCLLLALSCTVGVVHAAPASDGAVKTLVTRLGMGGLGTDMADLTVKSTPSLSALDEAQRVCARKPIQDMIDQGFRSSMIAGLGADGAQVVADWAQFLDTSAGKSLASVFAGSNAQTIADRAGAGLDETARAELDTFLRSPSGARLMAALDVASPMPDDHEARMAKDLKAQCGIVLTADAVS